MVIRTDIVGENPGDKINEIFIFNENIAVDESLGHQTWSWLR